MSISSKTHASDKPTQAQPALPQRLPARWPIAGTSQKSSQLSHAEDELLDGQPLDRHALLRGNHLCLLRLDPRHGWLTGAPSAPMSANIVVCPPCGAPNPVG